MPPHRPRSAAALLALALVHSLSFHAALARTREYYIAIDSVDWDYYPPRARAANNLNRCTGRPLTPDQVLFVGDGTPHQSGFTPTSVYAKLAFREYTDASFSTAKPRSPADEHLGLLGPLLRAAAGDVLKVTLRGAPVDHPLAAAYAFDIAGLPARPNGPVVQPGAVRTLRYNVTDDAAPNPDAFVNSTMLLYRGTEGYGPDGNAGLYRGLLGALIVYARGALRPNGKPVGVHRELVTILWVANENVGEEEGDEEESNLMHAINGMVYCALPGLKMKAGRSTRWHFGAVGNEVDVHTAHMHGLVGMNSGGQHTDSVRLLPGSTASLDMEVDNPGTWLMHCHINDHIHAGMQVLFNVLPPGDGEAAQIVPASARQREYFVQAEDQIWDYAPLGRNVCDDTEYGDDELIFTQREFPIDLGDDKVGYGIGSKYHKTRYIEYTDASYTESIVRDESVLHLGIMGPVLRARVGEVIVIHFRNNASEPISMHPHGVFYTKSSEGAPYNDGTSKADKADDRIPPGGTYTYRWVAAERAGPGPGERQMAKLWMYHSHRNEIEDTYAGLFGPLVIIGKDAEVDEETLLPSDGTTEAFLHMSVMNEGGSYLLEKNARSIEANDKLSAEDFEALLESDEFQESNLMHSINGYLYCNGPRIKLQEGKPTRFYFYALGTEVDLHTPMIGKEVLQLDVEASRGSGTLLAGTFASAIVTPKHAGLHELRCNVNDHVIAGMRALYFVEDDNESEEHIASANVTHYIAAEEIEWDYTSFGEDRCPIRPFGDDEKVFTEAGAQTPGSRYIKAVYRMYQAPEGDGPAFQEATGNATKEFSGVVGPLMHFEVGEIVKIVFWNNLSFAANMNLVGLQLISTTKPSLKINPGESVTYTLRVPEEAGPSESDLSSVPYVYYSSVDPISHVAAGLTGVIAVSNQGGLNKTTRLPVDTSEAYPLLLNIFRENESPLLEKSLSKFALEPDTIDEDTLESLGEDDDWLESNAMHSINGYLYGNNPLLHLTKGKTVRFYAFGYGSEASMHSPIWKGQILDKHVRRGQSADGVQILPFNAETVDVILASAGRWPVICGVADHVLGGMKVCIKVT